MKNINRIIDEVLTGYVIEHHTPFKEVKNFHPNGKPFPNGSHYQRGGYLNECRMNKNAFVLTEGVHGEQYGMAKYRGGVIVFSTEVNAVTLDKNQILNKIKQIITTYKNRFRRGSIIHQAVNKFNQENEEYIGAYSVGNYFQGKYVGDNGEMYNESSMCIEVNGLSSRSLLKLAELLCKAFMQETVLVKDLNLNKIYMADAIESDKSFDDEMDRINTEVK